MAFNAVRLTRLVGFCLSVAISSLATAQYLPVTEWEGYGGGPQHNGVSPWAAGQTNFVQWAVPVDTAPVYSGGELLAHYGAVGVSGLGSVIVGVVHGASNPFTVEAHEPIFGNLLWRATSHYSFPGHNWTPSFGATLLPAVVRAGIVLNHGQKNVQSVNKASNTPGGVITQVPYSTQVAWPEAGGQVSIRSNADLSKGTISTHAFYGDDVYALNPTSTTGLIKICTPLTCGADGSIYFGYYIDAPAGVHAPGPGGNSVTLTTSGSPITLTGGGLAVIRPNTKGAWVSAASLGGTTPGITQVQFNCAPAVSYDGSMVYIAASAGYTGKGLLVGTNTRSLVPNTRKLLIDPQNHQPATVTSDSTASPAVSSDGTVYFGVLENSFGSNDARGWLLHFSGDLKTSMAPGLFGWDCTPTIYPGGTLITCKYNDYAGAGGTGLNLVAWLEPYNPVMDTKTHVMVMGLYSAMLGPTPDPAFDMTHPGAVKEWCINSMIVDPKTGFVIANSEDGTVYEAAPIALTLVTPSYACALTSGLGEAYTSTAIGPEGNVYAMSNATLFAVNTNPPPPR